MKKLVLVVAFIFSTEIWAEPNNCGHDIELLSKQVVLSRGAPRENGDIRLSISAPEKMKGMPFSSLRIKIGSITAPLKEWQKKNEIVSEVYGSETELNKVIIAVIYGEGLCRIKLNIPAKA